MALELHEQINREIQKSQNILICFKRDFVGDALSSGLALLQAIKKMGKGVDLVSEDFQIPRSFTFLTGVNEVKRSTTNLRKFIISLDISKTKVDEISYDVGNSRLDFIISPREGFFEHKDISSKSSGYKYDLIICLNTPDLESLGKVYDTDTEFFYNTPIINIDYTPNNEHYGQINFIDLTANSVAEMVYAFIKQADSRHLTKELATMLLTGVIASTKSFKTPYLTPKTLAITSELINLGAEREVIIENLYRSRSLNTLKVWGKVLGRLKYEEQSGLVWSYISFEEVRSANIKEGDLEEVISELIINAPEAKIIALFYQLENNKTHCLINTEKNINALELARNFDPTGSKELIKFTLMNSDLAQAQAKVLDEIRKMNALSSRK